MGTFSLYLAVTIPIGSSAGTAGMLLSSLGCLLLSVGFVLNMISFCLLADDVWYNDNWKAPQNFRFALNQLFCFAVVHFFVMTHDHEWTNPNKERTPNKRLIKGDTTPWFQFLKMKFSKNLVKILMNFFKCMFSSYHHINNQDVKLKIFYSLTKTLYLMLK